MNIGALGLLTSLLLGRLATYAALTRESQRSNSVSSTNLFDQVLESGPLGPLHNSEEDELQRGPLLESLIELVREERNPSITFGLEGPWGSGKTSLLNALRNKLTDLGHGVVTLDLWSYRNPSRLIGAYVRKVEAELARQRIPLRSSRRLRRLVSGLSEFGGSRLARGARVLFGDFLHEDYSRTRRELESTLENLDRPLVILLDDLDRLENDELLAVLRLIQLMGDLPNVTHVVAYDRQQLAQSLFPGEGPASPRVRDYIAKVIQIELSLGSSPQQLIRPLLESTLQPLLGTVDEPTARAFREDVRHHGLATLLDALPTPRAVRRVVAATAWVWQRMSDHLNLFDLLVLTIIHYRHPPSFYKLKHRPEWFANSEWSNDPGRVLSQETWHDQGSDHIKELGEASEPDSLAAAKLLHAVLPHLSTSSSARVPDELDARRERRLCHPGIYNRYFHLYVPASMVAEVEVEELAESLESMHPGEERQKKFESRIRTELDTGRLESFMEQLDLRFSARQAREGQIPTDLIEDLSLGFARASESLPSDEDFLAVSLRRLAVFKIHYLTLGLQTQEELTELLSKVIETAGNLEFCGDIIHYASFERRRPTDRYDDEIEADVETLKSILLEKVLQRYSQPPSPLIGTTAQAREDLIAAIFRTPKSQELSDLVVRDLSEHPELLPYLLWTTTRIQLAPERGKVLVETLDLEPIAQRVDLETVDEVTRELPIEDFGGDWRSRIVERFRDEMRSRQEHESDGNLEEGLLPPDG